MFSKSFSLLSVFVLSLSMQACGHCLIAPVLGVQGTAARSDVQRPSSGSPCGSVDVASALAKSTVAKANNGAFTLTVQNFNGGQDGSTQINSATVDTTATGKNFQGKATITKNGVLAPPAAGTVQISGTLPAGTKCTGGADGSTCLVSFVTAGGFGNCVAISTGGAAGGGAPAPAPAAANNNGGNKAASATTTAETPKKSGGGKKKACNAAGSRKAREVKAREATGEFIKRDDQAWVWAE